MSGLKSAQQAANVSSMTRDKTASRACTVNLIVTSTTVTVASTICSKYINFNFQIPEASVSLLPFLGPPRRVFRSQFLGLSFLAEASATPLIDNRRCCRGGGRGGGGRGRRTLCDTWCSVDIRTIGSWWILWVELLRHAAPVTRSGKGKVGSTEDLWQ